jgi:HAD domain in Swiss Army Knife RNA repair proteins
VSRGLPLLLLDVDGVLNPFAAAGCPPGYAEHNFFPGEDPVRLCAGHGEWLRELGRRFEVVWATAWETEANRLIAPRLGIAELPVITFPPIPFEPLDKLPAVSGFVAESPLVWIDDALGPQVHDWAARRRAPTLLIDADPAVGLTRPMVERCLSWAARLDDQSYGGERAGGGI